MFKTIVVLPEGTELSSGVGTENAIKSMTLTECVNDGQELSLGSACANMIELTVISPNGGFSVVEGDEFTVYRENTEGTRQCCGIFISEKPTRASAHCLKLTAYDRVIRLDRDLTDWLAGLGEWPYRLDTFAHMICEVCKVTLCNTQLPNGDYLVQRFSAQGITGRQLMKWIGQIAGRFCRANEDGDLEFVWYSPGDIPIGCNSVESTQVSYDEAGAVTLDSKDISAYYANGVVVNASNMSANYEGNMLALSTLEEQLGYYQNSLSFADYQVAPIEKVQLKATADDVGTVYPADLSEAVNTYAITDNPLLTAQQGDALVPVARTLYEQLSALSYTPCKLTVPADARLHAGDILTVTDRNGVTFQTLVMTRRQSGQRDTLECTGSARRDSSAAVNSQSYQALSGKVMELKLDVDGLRLQNQETQGKLASLSLTVDGVESSVREQLDPLRQSVTELTQQADALHLSVQSWQTEGAGRVVTETGFTFDADGLHIQKNESDMENLLDETGMYVRRGGQTILQANDDGVEAVDVTVKNYLIVGSHARFEDYRDGTDDRRTACYWL